MKKMISTGNDIISLNFTDKVRTNDPKFYRRILADSEGCLYNLKFPHLPFEIFVWLFWSVKESAYKYLQRLTPELVFSPKKFDVTSLQLPEGYEITSFELNQMERTGFPDKSIKGTVNYGTHRLHFRSVVKKEFIMSVVNGNENFDNIFWGIKSIEKSDPEHQSKAVRELVMNRFKSSYRTNNIAINKNKHGFPVIAERNKEIPIPVSLSHHYHLVAYSYPS